MRRFIQVLSLNNATGISNTAVGQIALTANTEGDSSDTFPHQE